MTATSRPFRSRMDPWYIITNGAIRSIGGDAADRNAKISSSGEFMTTWILSAGQLREAKIFLHARLTVNTTSANAMLQRSSRLSMRTAKLVGSNPKMVVISSGIGSWRSSTTFAPSSFGTSVLNTRRAGMLCTWTSAKRRRSERKARRKNELRMNVEYCRR